MAVRKIKADKLFDGEKFLTGKVIVLDDEGAIVSIENDIQQDAACFQGILTPGFINCHCHLELSHLHGAIPKHTGLLHFLLAVLKLRSHEENVILDAIARQDVLMYERGIVAVGDICNTTHTIAQKKISKIRYRNFVETMGFVPEIADARFAFAHTTLQAFEANEQHAAIVPHAPYSVSDTLFQKINREAAGKIISIHNQETAEENKLFRGHPGGFENFYKQLGTDISFFVAPFKNSLQAYLPLLANAKKILLVHNSFTSEEDVVFAETFAMEKNIALYWILCPNANLYIEHTLPDVEVFIKNKCKLAIGTDSLSSNDELDVLSELRTLKQHFPTISTERLLQMATSEGASALGFSGLGKIESGKKPGINLVDENLNLIKKIT